MIGWCLFNQINVLTESSISIFPNPVHDVLFVNTGNLLNQNGRVKIYSSTGVKVSDVKLSAELVNPIDVSAIAPGVYFIRVYTDTTLQVGKFVKQ